MEIRFFMCGFIKLLPITFWLSVTLIGGSALADAADAPVDLEEIFRQAERVLAGVDSYTAVFHKQEQVKGKLLPAEKVALKFKKPFKVYMKWIAEPHKGRETLFVEGANQNRLKGHEGGLLGVLTVNLDPNGAQAMKGNRHPITDSGLEKLVAKLAVNVRLGRTNGEFEVRDRGEETVYGRKTTRLEGVFPKEKAGTYYCHRAVVNIDTELKVPIKVQIFDAANVLVELYGYEDLRLNAGLTEKDFDPANAAYGF
jgi:outer membrane lipoprotein-sorting protein